MPEPQGNDGEVDASLQQMHGGRVAQRMRGDGPPLKSAEFFTAWHSRDYRQLQSIKVPDASSSA
ncbi:hypothetical protein, partial [Propionivibrio sp.]|uniref:hypothetical protein n=1 Tax=Propionivibrio sp. TaxID=2212460 RepID=UPI0025E3F3B1